MPSFRMPAIAIHFPAARNDPRAADTPAQGSAAATSQSEIALAGAGAIDQERALR